MNAINTSDPIARLSYGTFQGRYSSTYNISYFRKIPFAAPPIGINRFRAPQPVIPIANGTYDAEATYPFCPQRAVNGSEDCLYLGLYSHPWSSSQPLRPVLLDFYGGAFIEGGGSFNIPPAAYPILNVSTKNNFVVVNPNYRVNAFGFLPGKEIANDPYSDLNVGLLDQHAVLQWVRENIRTFGGDPANVTIWGQSAGAGSVVAQAITNTTMQSGLITRALASSPFWPKTHHYASPEAESIYTTFASLSNCPTAGPESLACLKAVDVQTLRTAALAISGSHTYNSSSYTWAPVIGDSFLPPSLSQAAGNIATNLRGGAWGMYNLHEGENFVPPGLKNATTDASAPAGSGTAFNSSAASFFEWVNGLLPGLTAAQREELVTRQYPPSGTAENLPNGYNTAYIRAGLIYRDVVLACPALLAGQSRGSFHLGRKRSTGSRKRRRNGSWRRRRRRRKWVSRHVHHPSRHARRRHGVVEPGQPYSAVESAYLPRARRSLWEFLRDGGSEWE